MDGQDSVLERRVVLQVAHVDTLGAKGLPGDRHAVGLVGLVTFEPPGDSPGLSPTVGDVNEHVLGEPFCDESPG